MRTTLLLVLALAAALALRPQDLSWPQVKALISARFPEVPSMTVPELARMLEGPAPRRPLLLDARTASEYAVSHLPGAVRVNPGAGAPDLPPERPVVAYCSVGYRSALLVSRLRAAGHRRAYNLEGSIFEWANRGYPLEREGQRASRVHPYDAIWGRLLRPELRAAAP